METFKKLIFILAFGIGIIGISLSLISAEKKKRDVLRVGITATSEPIIFKSKNKIFGMEADFARGLAEHLDRDLKFVELPWASQIKALRDKRIDVIMSGMSITQERKNLIEFADPYLRVGQMAMVRTEDLVKYPLTSYIVLTKNKVGVIKGTTGEALVKRTFPYAKTKRYTNINSAVHALESKSIDMLVYDSPNVYWIGSQPDRKGVVPVFQLLSEEFLAWGVRKEDTHLIEQINNFLEGWRDDGRALETIAKWLPGLK